MTFIRSIYGENNINIAMQTDKNLQNDADWTTVSANQMKALRMRPGSIWKSTCVVNGDIFAILIDQWDIWILRNGWHQHDVMITSFTWNAVSWIEKFWCFNVNVFKARSYLKVQSFQLRNIWNCYVINPNRPFLSFSQWNRCLLQQSCLWISHSL